MGNQSPLISLCSAISLDTALGHVPEWVHLLPAGEAKTVDGRGPYYVGDLQSICAASLQAGQKLPIDEAHATDKGAALGLAHPALGWIIEMQARNDGIWGRVDWNKSGRTLMEDRAYSGISPVIVHDQSGNVLKVLRASLTNAPNLDGLTALQSAMPVIAKPVKPLNQTDHLIMALFSISEDDYRTSLGNPELPVEPSPVPELPSPLNDFDRSMMWLFSMDESSYRAAIAASKPQR